MEEVAPTAKDEIVGRSVTIPVFRHMDRHYTPRAGSGQGKGVPVF